MRNNVKVHSSNAEPNGAYECESA